MRAHTNRYISSFNIKRSNKCKLWECIWMNICTLVLGARPAIRAAAALPALFSSMKLIVELMTSNTTIPRKSCQSGGLPWIVQSIVNYWEGKRRIGEREICECYPSIGQSNGHDSSRLHDPWKGIPHKAQELEEFTLLFLLKFVRAKDL